jgi:hypothetical protein
MWSVKSTPDVVLRAAAEAIVPAATALDAEGWAALSIIVQRALSDRPGRIRRQFRLFLSILDLAPLARYGRRFRGLDVARRTRVLSVFEMAPVLPLRRGVWGLRTLVFMGYYARPDAARTIGYHANPRGWSARRDGPA